jgi:hypothetical protein
VAWLRAALQWPILIQTLCLSCGRLYDGTVTKPNATHWNDLKTARRRRRRSMCFVAAGRRFDRRDDNFLMVGCDLCGSSAMHSTTRPSPSPAGAGHGVPAPGRTKHRYRERAKLAICGWRIGASACHLPLLLPNEEFGLRYLLAT